jgi:hypothetical protein
MNARATLLVRPDGTCEGLYTEAIDLGAIGRMRVRRASTIEFDHAAQAWWVRLPRLGRLYCSPSRETCLRWERQYFETRGETATAQDR